MLEHRGVISEDDRVLAGVVAAVEAAGRAIRAELALQGRRVSGIGYPPGTPRAHVSAALQVVTTMGSRAIEAGTTLIQAGYGAEARPHVRFAWEAAIDLGYLLQARDRPARADLYLSMMVLRSPRVLGSKVDNAYLFLMERLIRQKVDVAKVLERYRDHPGRTGVHWSGASKRAVRDEGLAHLQRYFDDLGAAATFVPALKRDLFDAGHTFTHPDPGAYHSIASESPAGAPSPHAGFVDLAAALLLLPLARNLADSDAQRAADRISIWVGEIERLARLMKWTRSSERSS